MKKQTTQEAKTMTTATATALGYEFHNTPNSKAIPNNDDNLINNMIGINTYPKRLKLYKAWLKGWNQANAEMLDNIMNELMRTV